MKKLLSIIICIALLAGCIAGVQAADPAGFTDVSGHWAERYIVRATNLGLFNGTSDTTFTPEGSMSRAMFVTVLGRVAGIDPAAWAMNYDGALFSDVNARAYYAPYVNWAARQGIVKGVGSGRFAPDQAVTREQIAALLQRYADVTAQRFTGVGVVGEDGQGIRFGDESDISTWAFAAVYALARSGILVGMSDHSGGYHFRPGDNATRAQGATIFCRLLDALEPDGTTQLIPVSGLTPSTEQLRLEYMGEEWIQVTVFPQNAANQTLTWVSSDPTVATVEDGRIIWQGSGSCTVTVYASNDCSASISVTCDSAPGISGGSDSYTQKCIRIFGQYVSDPRQVYTSDAQASANMVSIVVPVWDIGAGGSKYSRSFTLQVHKNIAATVQQIFREIYSCPAQYPIHVLGGYRWDLMSEHNCGLAIDINPDENYYCSPGGTALVGSFFDPARSEYSIPVGGDIDRIFAKYGFTRGIYWRSGYKDYMHYSYFGT